MKKLLILLLFFFAFGCSNRPYHTDVKIMIVYNNGDKEIKIYTMPSPNTRIVLWEGCIVSGEGTDALVCGVRKFKRISTTKVYDKI